MDREVVMEVCLHNSAVCLHFVFQIALFIFTGFKWAAYDTIIDMGGIMAEEDYHYTANDTSKYL